MVLVITTGKGWIRLDGMVCLLVWLLHWLQGSGVNWLRVRVGVKVRLLRVRVSGTES